MTGFRQRTVSQYTRYWSMLGFGSASVPHSLVQPPSLTQAPLQQKGLCIHIKLFRAPPHIQMRTEISSAGSVTIDSALLLICTLLYTLFFSFARAIAVLSASFMFNRAASDISVHKNPPVGIPTGGFAYVLAKLLHSQKGKFSHPFPIFLFLSFLICPHPCLSSYFSVFLSISQSIGQHSLTF